MCGGPLYAGESGYSSQALCLTAVQELGTTLRTDVDLIIVVINDRLTAEQLCVLNQCGWKVKVVEGVLPVGRTGKGYEDQYTKVCFAIRLYRIRTDS